MKAAFILAAFALIACEGAAAPGTHGRPDPTPAQRLAQAAGARGEAPGGDYACRLGNPDHPGDGSPYGSLAIRGEGYRIALASGGTLSGQIHSTPAGSLIWNGPLGPIDAPPRRIARAGVRASEDAVSLIFDFAPSIGDSTRVVCVMGVGASI